MLQKLHRFLIQFVSLSFYCRIEKINIVISEQFLLIIFILWLCYGCFPTSFDLLFLNYLFTVSFWVQLTSSDRSFPSSITSTAGLANRTCLNLVLSGIVLFLFLSIGYA